jgi:hypothetical protein
MSPTELTFTARQFVPVEVSNPTITSHGCGSSVGVGERVAVGEGVGVQAAKLLQTCVVTAVPHVPPQEAEQDKAVRDWVPVVPPQPPTHVPQGE